MLRVRARDVASSRADPSGPPSGAAARVRLVFGDVSVLQGLPENAQATFQVASQFNCLEFVSPRVTPEDGPPFAARTSQAHARFQSHKYRLCAPS